MNCKEAQKYISSLVDLELDEKKENELLVHIDHCSECKRIYKEEKNIKEQINNFQLDELPNNFNKNLNKKLKKEENSNRLMLFAKRYKKYIAIAAVFIFAVILVNQNFLKGSYQTTSETVKEEAAFDSNTKVERSVNTSKTKSDPKTFTTDNLETNNKESKSRYKEQRVIIKNGTVNIDILDYNKMIEKLKSYLDSNNGYISNLNSYKNDDYMNGSIDIKIDYNKFDKTYQFIKSLGKVNNSNINTQDITNQYRDLVSEVETLKITQNRLQKLLNKSDKIEDILRVENELTRIRTRLEKLQGQIKKWERLSDYSSISITFKEVESLNVKINPVDKNLISKIKQNFYKNINQVKKLFENLVLFIASNIIYIFIILTFLIIIKKSIGGKNEKN
ncbi:MAG: DUF4349 domain-containing protein [Bacillota bacterium]